MKKYLILVGSLLVLLIPSVQTQAFNSLAGRDCDFNGDGFDDQAFAPAFEDLGTLVDAGAVNVIYGSAAGPTSVGNQFWAQNSPGVRGIAEAGDHFGAALSCGDFNGDGFDDLAVGVPGEDPGDMSSAGAVNVLLGSATGLTVDGNQLWSQDSPGVVGGSEAGDLFGSVLASGDFNGDGYDDVAIGAPGEDVGDIASAGALNVLLGSATGLTDVGNQFWSQNNVDVLDQAEAGDRFGDGLASGDFNGDAFDDLAIGVPSEDVGAIANAGAVNVLPGSATGLSAAGNQFWSQNSPGVVGGSEAGDLLGGDLASGNFNGDGFDDLAIGVSGEDIGAKVNAGGVSLLPGSAELLTAVGNQFWSQDSPGVVGGSESGDGFGGHVASGNFNGDGFDDLAIGVSGEDIGAKVNAGGVSLLPGSAELLTAVGNQFWSQDSPGIPGGSEKGDNFGASVATGDLNADSFDDLAVGVPRENIGSIPDACLKHDFFGSDTGLTSVGNMIWDQDSPEILDSVEARDCGP
jgi:hypothetical protein